MGAGKPAGKSQLLVQTAQPWLFAYSLCQEPKTDQDEEHCRKVNECLNNPPMPGTLGASGSSGHELSALGGNYHLDLCGTVFFSDREHCEVEPCLISPGSFFPPIHTELTCSLPSPSRGHYILGAWGGAKARLLP